MEYCVYMHTCPKGRVYIGITRNNPLKRWQNGTGYRTNEYFTRAIKKSLDLVNKENSETLSSYLSSSFPSSSIKEIISVLDNYKKIEAWPTSLNLSSTSFASLETIMKEANQLPSSYTSCYEQVVTDKIVSLV